MSTEAILVAGTTVEIATNLTTPVYTVIPGIMSFGAVGEVTEAKDKTTVADTVKKYGTSIKDTQSVTIKGQFLSTDTDQQTLVTAAKANAVVLMKVTYPDTTVATITLQLLGFTIDEGSAEDWLMFSIPARQSGAVTWA